MATRREVLIQEIQADLTDTQQTATRIIHTLLTERGPRIERVSSRASELRSNARDFRYNLGCMSAVSMWLEDLDSYLWTLESRLKAFIEPNVV